MLKRLLSAPENEYRNMVSLVLKGAAFFLILRYTIYLVARIVLMLMRAGYIPELPVDTLNSITMLVFSLIGLTLPFLFTAKEAGLRPRQVLCFRRSSCGHDFLLFFAGLGLCLGLNVAIGLLTQFLQSSGAPVSIPTVDKSDNTAVNALLLLSSAFLGGLLEEIAMRGVFFQSLRKYGEWFAILFVGILFGCLHANLMQGIFAAMVGILFGFIAAKTHSILLPVLIHITNNLLVESSAYRIPGLALSVDNALKNVVSFGLIFAGIVCCFLLLSQNPHFLRLSAGEEPLPAGSKIRGVAASPFLLAFLAVWLITGWLL